MTLRTNVLIMYGVKARQKKSKARLERYNDLVAQDRDMQQRAAQIRIPAGQRLGVTTLNLLRLLGAVILLGTTHLILHGELWPEADETASLDDVLTGGKA